MRNLTLTAYLAAVSCATAYGQPAPQSFEVASVKPAAPSNGRARTSMRGGPGTPDPGQLTFTNVTLTNVVVRAYDVNAYQVAGPDWLTTLRYDIAAKIPPGTTKEQFQQMLQNLVTERFHLALHHETREFPGYELVPGRSGPKLKASTGAGSVGPPEPASPPKTDPNGFPHLDGPGMAIMEGVKGRAVISYLTARAQPLSALVDLLSREFRIPIVDKTGLTGMFDFTLEFAPQPPGALPPPPSMDGLPDTKDESGPNLITAVPQQLGLRLNPNKVPLDVLVIDHADRIPTEK